MAFSRISDSLCETAYNSDSVDIEYLYKTYYSSLYRYALSFTRRVDLAEQAADHSFYCVLHRYYPLRDGNVKAYMKKAVEDFFFSENYAR